MIDSNDRERIAEAEQELQSMLREDELRDAILLIFANKQDLPNAMSAAELTDKLGKDKKKKNKKWTLWMSWFKKEFVWVLLSCMYSFP